MFIKGRKFFTVLIVATMVFSGLALVTGDMQHPSSGGISVTSDSLQQNASTVSYPNGNSPTGAVYDPYNQEIYIVNSGSSNVTVVNAFTGISVANISVGDNPQDITYVPYNHDIYVDNYGSNNISVISSSSNRVVATFGVPGNPIHSVFDPQDNTLFVAGNFYSSSELWIISVTNNTLLSTPSLPLNAAIEGFAFDPYNGYVYAADSNNNVVYAFTYSGNLVATIQTGQNPMEVAFDPVNKMLYVTDYDSNSNSAGSGPREYNVTVINTTTNTFVKNIIPGNQPEGITYDPVNGYIYVSNDASHNISVIDPTNETIIETLNVTDSEPTATIYDPVLQQMISIGTNPLDTTINFNSAGVYVQQLLNSQYSKSLTYDPVNRLLYVADSSSNINVYSLSGVLVHEIQTPGVVSSLLYANNTVFAAEALGSTSGLALINPDTNTVTKNISINYHYINGLAYDSLNNTLFVSLADNNAIGVINLSNYHMVATNIEVGIYPGVLTYSNITNQVYVAQEDDNIHIINASSYVNIYPYSVAGSDPSQIAYDPYTNSIYIANAGNNSMFVINESRIYYKSNDSTLYSTIYLGSPQSGIVFDPSNGLIYITESSDIVRIFNPLLNEIVGSINAYPLRGGGGSLTYIPGAQIILISNSNGGPVEISPAETYDVTFSVGSMIPNGTPWNLQIQPLSDSALAQVYDLPQLRNQTVSLPLPDGTYAVNITSNYGVGESINSYLVVNGTQSSFGLYNINFTEAGLPAGTAWYVNFSNGGSYGSSKPYIDAYLPNGSYSYTLATTDKKYAASGNTLIVNGKPQNVSVSFLNTDFFAEIFEEHGLKAGTEWGVLVNGTEYSTSSSNLSVRLTNGSYTAQIISPTGYFPTPSKWLFTVHNSSSSYPVNFAYSSNETYIEPSGTLYPLNNQTFSGGVFNSSYISAFSSYGMAYDSSSGLLFIPEFAYFGSGSIYVYNTWTGHFARTIGGLYSYQTIYDQSTKLVYSMSFSGNITEINPYTMSVVKNLTVPGSSLFNLIYLYPDGNYIYALNTNGNFSVISASTLSLVNTVRIHNANDISPLFTVYGGNAFIANISGNDVIILNLSTYNQKQIQLPTNYTPESVLDYYGSSLLVGGKNYSDQIYNTSSGQLSVGPMISGTATSIAYNSPYNSDYIESIPYFGTGLGNITVINLSNGSIIARTPDISSLKLIFSPTNGNIYADSFEGGIVSIYSTPHMVTFTESGLPSGTTWYVNGTGMSGHAVSPTNITFLLNNGTYTFTVTNLSNYYTTISQFTVHVNGNNVTENVQYYHWAYISGSISPSNATMTINGNSVTVSSSGHFNVSVANGTYHVVASENGYVTYYNNFTLNSGGVKNLTIVLKPVTKSSSISSIELYAIIGSVIVVALIGSVLVLLRRR